MILEALSLIVLAADMGYHRWKEAHPEFQKIGPQQVSIPRVDAAAPAPLLFGKCRVRAPILAWTDTPTRDVGDGTNGWPSGVTFYKMSMFFVVGIPFTHGTTKLHGMWAGDHKFAWLGVPDNAHGNQILVEIHPSTPTDSTDQGYVGMNARWYDGRASQDLEAAHPGAAMIAAGADASQVSSYIDYLTCFLYTESGAQWMVGSSPNVPAYSFEQSSYKEDAGFPALYPRSQIGDDSNPVNVIYDILTGTELGKLGIPTSYIDKPSFQAAASTCWTEGNGYSRSFESISPAADKIAEVLKQIDGVLDEDPTTGKLVLRLIRGDYNANDALHVTDDNCFDISDFVYSGYDGIPASVQVIFTSRAKDYNDDDVIVYNQGNIVDQGQFENVSIHMPGCTNKTNATNIANRELTYKSTPTMKFSVLVGREFADTMRGDVVKVTLSRPGIAGEMFRVADVNRGQVRNGKVRLDLISDVFYTKDGMAIMDWEIPDDIMVVDADFG